MKRTGSVWEMESDLGRAFDLGLRIIVNPLDRLHRGQLCEILGLACTHDEDLPDGLQQLCRIIERIADNRRRVFGILLNAWTMLSSDVNRFPQAVACIKDYLSKLAESSFDAAAEYALAMQDMEYLSQTWSRYAHENAMDRRSLGHLRNQMNNLLALNRWTAPDRIEILRKTGISGGGRI